MCPDRDLYLNAIAALLEPERGADRLPHRRPAVRPKSRPRTIAQLERPILSGRFSPATVAVALGITSALVLLVFSFR